MSNITAKKFIDFSDFDGILISVLRVICVFCFILLMILLSGNVFVRYFPVAAFYWFDEVVECLFAWMVFFGAAALWARDEHFKLSWISEKLQGTSKGHMVSVLLEIVSLGFLLVFAYQAMYLTVLARDWTPVFNLSRRYLYGCMPISGIIMVGYSIRNIVREVKSSICFYRR
jgi:TRAP-type C4-dicarboxylate transport system permease small subunit